MTFLLPSYKMTLMDETEILQEELEHYKQEKERVRKILGQIGGTSTRKRDQAVNTIFLILVIFLFAFEFQINLISKRIRDIEERLDINTSSDPSS